MTNMYISFHRCDNIRLAHTYVGNANSVQLEIEHDGVTTEITLYDLPSEVTAKLAALRDAYTYDIEKAA